MLEKKVIKALVGFLEPIPDLLEERNQQIMQDMMNQEMDPSLRKAFVKSLYLNMNLVHKAPISFQHFAAQTVSDIYKRLDWKIEKQIPLDWIIKYLTIFSILVETAHEEQHSTTTLDLTSRGTDQDKEILTTLTDLSVTQIGPSDGHGSVEGENSLRTSSGPMINPFSSNTSQTTVSTYNYVIDVIRTILEVRDFGEEWVQDGIDILFKCITYPNLSNQIQGEYLGLIRAILESPKYDPIRQPPYKFQDQMTDCLLIMLRNTLYSRHRSYIINLLNLITRKVPGTDPASLSLVIGDILQHRTIDEHEKLNLPQQVIQKKVFQEWAILLNNLWRFMFAKDPDFSCEVRNMIEDSSSIRFPEILNIIYDIYYNLDKDNRQKVIQDLIMLFGFDKNNAVTTFRRSDFLNWVMDILFDTAATDILDLALQGEQAQGRPEVKGLLDLAVKLVAVFLDIMMFKTSYERVIFFKFLGTFEKNILSKCLEWKRDSKIREIGDPEELILKLRAKAEALRARILSHVLDNLSRASSEERASYGANPHMVFIRISNYMFGRVSSDEIERLTQVHTEETGPEQINNDMKTPTPLQMNKKFSFPGSDELPTGMEEGVYQSQGAKGFSKSNASQTPEFETLLMKCYNFEKFKEFARFDESQKHWVDEPVFDSLKKAFEPFLKYKHIEEFITEVDKDKASISIDLLYRNKQEKNEPKLLISLVLSVLFAIDWHIDSCNGAKVEDCLLFLEKLFANVYAMTEIERKNLKKVKYRYLDSVLVFVLYYLADRKEATAHFKRHRPGRGFDLVADLVHRTKHRLWKGLVLSLRFDMEKLLVNKESGGLKKMFSMLTPSSKVYLFVDDLLFKKFAITSFKKEDLKNPKNIEQFLAQDDYFPDFLTKVQDGELRLLLESNFTNKETNRSEFNSRAETVQEVIKSVYEENMIVNNRKRLVNKLRTELEESMKNLKNDLEETFMSSDINVEMVVRDCRNIAHSMLLSERDLGGLWCNPELRLYSQKDEPFVPKDEDWEDPPNKYYVYELNPWCSHKFSRPFLKLRLKPYWGDDSNTTGDKEDREMNIFDRGSNKNRNKKRKLMPTKLKRNVKLFTQRILNTAASGATMLISGKAQVDDSNKVLFSRSCEWLSRFTIYSGLVMVTKKKLIFCTDNIKTKNYLSILNVELDKHDRVKYSWDLADILEIQKRRVVQRKTGIEIFFQGGYSVLLNMPPDQNDSQEFHDLLMSLRESFLFASPFSKIRSTRNVKLLEANRYTERWQGGELTNFHYLMILNSYAGRSYHDLSQYPVFPWVFMIFKPIANSTDVFGSIVDVDPKLTEAELFKEDIFSKFELRNLSKPMGALGSASRNKCYQEKFNTKDHFSDAPSYHYGSHYSSPAIVLHYLIRISPFTEGAKAIQNGHFDLPDRLYFSLQSTFRNSLEETSDVRELIPEFYYLPEFLLNMNKLDLGICQTNERVHHVGLPEWANKNPYLFTYVMARLLESPSITLTLKNWIDLVFGYKQTGEEAEKAQNVFYHLTYEDAVDMDALRDLDRQGVETQVVHFGQTPSKLFLKPHPGPTVGSSNTWRLRSINIPTDAIQIYAQKRIMNPGETASISYSGEYRSFNDLPTSSVFKVLSSPTGKRVVVLTGSLIMNYTWDVNIRQSFEHPSEEIDPEQPFKFNRAKAKDVQYEFFSDTAVLKDRDPNIDLASYPVVFFDEARVLIVGGYASGIVDCDWTNTDQGLAPREEELQRIPQPRRDCDRAEGRQTRKSVGLGLSQRFGDCLGKQRE